MNSSIGAVTFLVRESDEAIDWFTQALDFELLEDTPLDGGKRWVLVAPRSGSGTALLLAKAIGEDQLEALGRQAGGRVFLFLHTDDFHDDHTRMIAAGVTFREEPRNEAYGAVAVFEDLYGNPWDLIGPKR